LGNVCTKELDDFYFGFASNITFLTCKQDSVLQHAKVLESCWIIWHTGHVAHCWHYRTSLQFTFCP